MNNKNIGIVVTIVTVLLCGLPGLIVICSGAILVFSTQEFDDPIIGFIFSFSLLCLGLFFIAIPIAAGILTYRDRSKNLERVSQDEPIPPTS